MNYTDKTITMDDGKKYIVIEQVDYDNKNYLYIINSEEESDARFVEVANDQIRQIDPQFFQEIIFPLFVKKFSE